MKKLLSLTLAAIMLFAVIPFSVSAVTPEPPYYIGDINCDGCVDMFDYLLIKSIYFEQYTPSDAESKIADINGDNSIDMFDYLLVKRAYFTDALIKNRKGATI